MMRKLAGPALASLGILVAAAPPAKADVAVEFDLPAGQQVSAVQMAQALVKALETADAAQRPLLLHALAKVLELPPDALLADSSTEKPQPVY